MKPIYIREYDHSNCTESSQYRAEIEKLKAFLKSIDSDIQLVKFVPPITYDYPPEDYIEVSRGDPNAVLFCRFYSKEAEHTASLILKDIVSLAGTLEKVFPKDGFFFNSP